LSTCFLDLIRYTTLLERPSWRDETVTFSANETYSIQILQLHKLTQRNQEPVLKEEIYDYIEIPNIIDFKS
jgi:hypothetical protein